MICIDIPLRLFTVRNLQKFFIVCTALYVYYTESQILIKGECDAVHYLAETQSGVCKDI